MSERHNRQRQQSPPRHHSGGSRQSGGDRNYDSRGDYRDRERDRTEYRDNRDRQRDRDSYNNRRDYYDNRRDSSGVGSTGGEYGAQRHSQTSSSSPGHSRHSSNASLSSSSSMPYIQQSQQQRGYGSQSQYEIGSSSSSAPLRQSNNTSLHSSQSLHASSSPLPPLSSSQSRPASTGPLQLNIVVPTHQTAMHYRGVLMPESAVPGVPVEVYKLYQEVTNAMTKSDTSEDQAASIALAASNTQRRLGDFEIDQKQSFSKYYDAEFKDRVLLGDLEAIEERRRQISERGGIDRVPWRLPAPQPL